MAKSIQIIIDHGALDIEVEHCYKHNEWYTERCKQCTIDRMEEEKQEWYDRGHKAGQDWCGTALVERYYAGIEAGKAARNG